ncbi:TnpV protein [Lachnoanaerobaculum sp. Marseille-Q4761]|uniref:TnpV protein n=1 Tax=Lachnoanaerobaculum sp. Marseille-Q4761 TaxID=2819511 RepID=UPI001AA1C907|nr:TnpV protein [Lachnoanaerobaculum sp. Marseille-Q4761]
MRETVILADREYILEEEIYIPVIKENLFEKQGGTYSLEKMEDGEEVLIPNIEMPKIIDQSRLNRFGRERLKFLKENRENQYQSMYYRGKLMEHLLNIEEQAQEFLEKEEPKMMEAWGLTNELKSEDFLKYTGLKKNLDMTLTRMVLEQIVWA